MSIFGLARRVRELEERLDKMEREGKCSRGEHDWTMYPSYDKKLPPYIKCSRCYTFPPTQPS